MMESFKKRYEIEIIDIYKRKLVLNLIDRTDGYYRVDFDLDNQRASRWGDITKELVWFWIQSNVNEEDIENKLDKFYLELDKLNVNYILRDMDTGKILKEEVFEYREEIIVYLNNVSKLTNFELHRKFDMIKDIPRVYKIPNLEGSFGKIDIVSVDIKKEGITIIVKLYSDVDDCLRKWESLVISEFERFNVDFEFEINHFD